MSSRFLFELGTEEIPASMIDPALEQLAKSVEDLLRENQISWKNLRTGSTPRRLVIWVDGLPDRCPDRDEVLTGPPKSVALDANGNFTQAAIGFARKAGVTVDELTTQKTDRGEYLSVCRTIPGDFVRVILERSLPGVIASLSWPKNMYWRESRFRFIRPLRWFLCLWNDEVVAFEFEGVDSGRITRGHRFLGRNEIPIPHVDQYQDLLRQDFVIVDPTERRTRIEAGLSQRGPGLSFRPDTSLLDIVVNLNEFPDVLEGDFDPEFLELPEEVLVTVMRFHQKYFSLSDESGGLAPKFLTVINTNGDPEGMIRKGHERVLQARLEDAAFFWESDQKIRMEVRVEQLGHVLFQERLGTYLEKTERIGCICAELDPSSELAIAARLCKADLTTDMVREFPELQGVMGGLYVRQEGYSEQVWKAIYDHYQPVSLEDRLPETRTGVLLSLADRLDTVVGCFGIGIVPTGSSDPFALRRQAQGLISLLHAQQLDYELDWLVGIAQKNFHSQNDEGETRQQVLNFLQQRIQFIFQREGLPTDVLRAVFAAGVTTVPDVYKRAVALAAIKGEPNMEALAVAFKRIRNILEKQSRETVGLRKELLRDDEEKRLYAAFLQLKPKVEASIAEGDPASALKEMAAVRTTVDLFFDRVLVMAKEPEVRENRMALLRSIAEVFLSVADISEIVQ